MPNINAGIVDGIRRPGARFRDVAADGGNTGVPYGLRIRGTTTSGPPATGSWRAYDVVADTTGRWWMCTASGSPGTWATVANLASPTQFPVTCGAFNSIGTSGAAARSDHSHGLGLDSTAGDFQGLGTAAAGSTGKPADAGHVHPATTTGNLTIGGDGLNIAVAGITAAISNVNSTSLITAASLTVPANEPAAGTMYEIDVIGAYATASANTNLTFAVAWGGTSLGSNAFTMPASISTAAPARWRFKGTIAFVSTTQCYANLRLEYVSSNSANTAASVFLYGANPSSGQTVTVSPAQALALTLQWTTASTSNEFWVTGGRIWKAS